MKIKIFIPIVLISLISLVLVKSANSQKPQPFSFLNTYGETMQVDTFLEEYTPAYAYPCTLTTCVHNPFGGTCAWDVNDHANKYISLGYIDPGVIQTTTNCLVSYSHPTYSTLYPNLSGTGVSGGVHNWYGVSIDAVGSSSLSVTICWQPQNKCFNPAPKIVSISQNKTPTYEWNFCGQAVYKGPPNLDPALIEIPDSNGAYGLQTTVTLSVENNGSTTIKSVTGSWGYSSDVFFPTACPSDINGAPPSKYNMQFSYPLKWIQSQ